jgi:lysophospholipase L1-like esterase
MQQILLTLGDSWPEGAELNFGDKRYGELIQDVLGYDKFYNYGSAGASNEDMMYQLQRYIAESHEPGNQVTAVFFLTNPARTAHFPRFFSWEADLNTKMKEVYLHFYRKEHEVIRSSSTVSALQAWCANLGFDDYYFSGWVRYPVWLPGTNTNKIWAHGNETAADWFGASKHNGEHLLDVKDNRYIHPNFAHPNQSGHELIANKLTGWISQTR